MYRVPGICIFIEARSLVSNAPTWNKQSSEMFTHSLAELVRVLRRGVLARSHSNVFSALEVREHSILCRRMILESAWLFVLRRGEGAPETLMGASNHSSISLCPWVSEHLKLDFG